MTALVLLLRLLAASAQAAVPAEVTHLDLSGPAEPEDCFPAVVAKGPP